MGASVANFWLDLEWCLGVALKSDCGDADGMRRSWLAGVLTTPPMMRRRMRVGVAEPLLVALRPGHICAKDTSVLANATSVLASLFCVRS